MKTAIGILTATLLTLVTTACDNFEYHPYSIKIHGQKDINATTIEQLETAGIKAPFKFAFITDTQGALSDMNTALDLIKQRGDIDFIIHGGDMTDFGLPKEYVWARDMLNNYGIPFLTIIGNHDCLGNGEDTFKTIFGPENFSLNIDHVHIVGLNTVALEYDYSRPVPDLDFIENDRLEVDDINAAHPDSLTHTIVAMHSRPYDEQFNNNVAKVFNYYLLKYPGMEETTYDRQPSDLPEDLLRCPRGFCINGHNHSTSISDIFDNGILYYQCANMAKRTFFIFTITEDGYEHEVVEF